MRRTDPLTHSSTPDFPWTATLGVLANRQQTRHKKEINKKCLVLIETLAEEEMHDFIEAAIAAE